MSFPRIWKNLQEKIGTNIEKEFRLYYQNGIPKGEEYLKWKNTHNYKRKPVGEDYFVATIKYHLINW